MIRLPRVVLLIESSRAHGQGLLRGIAKYARLHGPWMFYRTSPTIFNEENSPEFQQIKLWKPHAAIYWPHSQSRSSPQDNITYINNLISLNIPTIFPFKMMKIISANSNMIDIGSDVEAIYRTGLQHLLERGFQHLAFCGYDLAWSRQIGDIFARLALEKGHHIHQFPPPQSQNRYSWPKDEEAMAAWLASLPKPLGMMAVNDDRSQDVVEAAKIAQIRIPQEMALLGVDNDEFICELSHVPLSSVALNTEQAGYEAADHINQIMADKPVSSEKITIKPTFVVSRQSTDILAIKDQMVAHALWYISQNARKPIQVSDVIGAVSISRRVLEKRFNKHLKRSILDEIRRVRTDHIAKLLSETTLSLPQIAIRLGFPSVDNMYQYFQRNKKMGLREWRKLYGS